MEKTIKKVTTMKEIIEKEITAKDVIKANYWRQIKYIEAKLKLLTSPVNNRGNVEYVYVGKLVKGVKEYFEAKGFAIYDYSDPETKRRNNGHDICVFAPAVNVVLTEEEIEEAQNISYERMSEREKVCYISGFYSEMDNMDKVTPGDDDYDEEETPKLSGVHVIC